MKLLLSSLLLASLCALSSWSVSSGTHVVTQSPDVSVMEGDTVNITCCWPPEFTRLRVKWLINQTVQREIFSLQNHSNCTKVTLTNVTRENSGRYICKVTVELPLLTTVEGNGTVITVRNNTKDNHEENTREGPQVVVIICLAVVAPLLLITLLCYYALRRRQAQAARVIYEVPHIDSEEVEMDKHSTSSSRGSSQWCQVPLYDYFERVENKESE